MMRTTILGLGITALCWLVSGCAVTPPVSATSTAAAAPMTLPHYLGVTTVMHSAHKVVYRSRLRLARHVPLLEPAAPAAVPLALGDPAALQSPAPAVAAAASIQQAEASAPAKVAALSYLAKVDCTQHPQAEEALLASLADPIDAVRIAAIQAIISGQQRCGNSKCHDCNTGCKGGCCTPAIHARLLAMATQQNDQGCWCEPNPTARRLARVALTSCTPTAPTVLALPEEVPAPEVLQAIGL